MPSEIISIKVKPRDKEMIVKVARALNISTSELVKRALFHYLRLYYNILPSELQSEVVAWLIEEGLL